jgi:hypothetical protein
MVAVKTCLPPLRPCTGRWLLFQLKRKVTKMVSQLHSFIIFEVLVDYYRYRFHSGG